ncbi:hypothetical protein IGI04_035305 [Brassica rapa subsp. trilocularis]|uniref:Cation/H+ exchanger transmembrane domain-containing protein n=1 Tax=Brassica rapa subsp. trilocularis TaxID=1813537 RepID=A0ABQ7LB75_BRACM|nr:hypothetical protein IGI04_035305 [Brassica rapa subsp. trilocularis]
MGFGRFLVSSLLVYCSINLVLLEISRIIKFFRNGDSNLFEMGLELSLARLKALAKFAFGMGLSQVLLCTLAFTAFELPPNGAIGTRILEFLFHSRPDLNLVGESILPMLAKESAKALGGLGFLSLGGKFFLGRIFEVVAETRSSEAFVALCLLTVAGTSLLTQKLGFSDTLGAFLAGALLAETNFRTQIEADIRPFRGLLLGLVFVTTGTSVDMEVLFREWPNVLTLLAGLIVIKTLIITALGPRVGLTLQESVRIGFLLSQGGEFAFVVFSLANRLGVLPLELNKLLIIVVVLSMALTPTLNQLGRKAADFILDWLHMSLLVLANFLSTPLVAGVDSNLVEWPYIGFDLNPAVVKESRKQDLPHLLELKKAGATDASLEKAETSLQLGSKMLRGFGVMSDDVSFLSRVLKMTLHNNP